MMATILDFREQARADDRGFARGHRFITKERTALPRTHRKGVSPPSISDSSLQILHLNAISARMIERFLLPRVLEALKEAPAVCLLGPRQVGKTTPGSGRGGAARGCVFGS